MTTKPPTQEMSEATPPPKTAEVERSIASQACERCHSPITGQYVRAMGTVYHVDCFRCIDCNEIVTAKFFSYTMPDSKQIPLCEVDYFKRLDLICAKCRQALRGSYITTSDKKYHVEHFTCSCCSTQFGPQDSYYEHQDSKGTEAYCHYHYSSRCAQKCTSCQTAILRQYLEVNRSSRDETYHIPCYFIQKYWNVKIGTPLPPLVDGSEPWRAEESRYTPETLKEAQKTMDALVNRILTVLSAFEESSAACISDLLRSVSSVVYLEAIRSAERFTFHVEVLFAALDDLDFHFNTHGSSKGIAHRDVSRQGMTQELLGLITGIAHYLKVLLRIALLGALRLMREYNDSSAIKAFLDQLQRLMEENGDPLASRRITIQQQIEAEKSVTRPQFGVHFDEKPLKAVRSRDGVAFGFKSLDPEVTGNSPYAQEYYDVQHGTNLAANFTPPSDLCAKCNSTIESNCVRLGTYIRWHLQCLTCDVCGKAAGSTTPLKVDAKQTIKGSGLASAPAPAATDGDKDEDAIEETETTRQETRARLQENLDKEYVAEAFTFDVDASQQASPNVFLSETKPSKVYCTEHRTGRSHLGFQCVSRLEQYSYLLNVALLRLYSILKRRGAILPPTGPLRRKVSSPRESIDAVRMRSLSLDRKSTAVKTPKRLTIIESPIGRVAHTNDFATENKGISSSPKRSQKPLTPPSPKKRTKPSTPPSPSQRTAPRPGSPHSEAEPEGSSFVPMASITGAIPPRRPEFTRMNSQVVVMEEVQNTVEFPVRTTSPIQENVDDDRDSFRLADITSLVEAEQARERSSTLSSTSAYDAPYLSDLDNLDSIIVKHAALWLLNHSELKDKFDADDILEGIEVRKAGLWGKFFRGEKKVKKKGVFGVPLELLTERDGVETSLGVSRSMVKIPVFLDDIICAMQQMDVSVEGIFRKNGNLRRVKEAIEAMERSSDAVDFTQENPIQLAALLKKFFIDLPDPLLTHRLYTLFMATQTISDEEERTRLLHLACTLVPKCHRSTMEVFFAFLKWISLFSNIDSAGSKMDIPNLSTVIAPSVLCSKTHDPHQSFSTISVVTSMLEEQDLFNRVPEQCLQLLAERKDLTKAATESSKDLLKKCQQFFTGKNNLPGSKAPLGSPIASQFTPSTLHSHKSEGSLDGRGRIPNEKKPNRSSKSLERKDPRERSNTLRKAKPPHPGLPHAPFSMPSGITSNGSTPKLIATDPSSFNTFSSLASTARGEIQPSLKSSFTDMMTEGSPPTGNGHLM
ncbi:hypothetical protein FRC19_008185 [Serendipita sp. 401]|nr:hypothetical protein FRC19_008185 [Serendipita sp. 401]